MPAGRPGRPALRGRAACGLPAVRGDPQWGIPQRTASSRDPKPSAYWPLSVVGFLFSFLLGGIALYFSSQVGRRWNRGDVAGARKASRTAVILSIAGILLGLVAAVYLLSTDSAGY